MKTVIFCCFLFFLALQANGQSWIRIYSGEEEIYTYQCAEHYDKGYLLGGMIFMGGEYRSGWILKTDINGVEKYHKILRDVSVSNNIVAIKPTNDGGYIVTGESHEIDPMGDPIIIKFNACGEKEWCKIFNYPNHLDYGSDIVTTPGGGFMALIRYWGNDPVKRIWLFNLTNSGDIIWQKSYAYDSTFRNSDVWQLSKGSDTNFVISGETYYPDTLPVNNFLLTPLFVKVGLNGKEEWVVPWRFLALKEGEGCQTVLANNGRLLSSIKHIRTTNPLGNSPCLVRTSSTGKPLGYKNLENTSTYGIGSTIDFFHDSTLAIGGGWQNPGQDFFLGVWKTDTLGNIQNNKILKRVKTENPTDGCVTYDDKFLLIAPIFNDTVMKWQTYAFKLNSNLEYDSVYTHPFTYDSLCPHVIISDTVSLKDCTVTTSVLDPLQDKDKAKLKIYPNPTSNTLTLVLPEYLSMVDKKYGITATTIYHQWGSTTLEVCELNGALKLSKLIPQSQDQIILDVSSWSRGIYFFRLMYNNNLVAGEKVVIN